MHVSLTPELEKAVRDKVKSGMYNNASEVVREALRHLIQSEELNRYKLERLREAVAVGADQIERGEFAEESFDEIIAQAKRMKDV
ncbi:MAG TPA: type II toxin-antitoxin system ParD family antitoxin [Acidobacteriota bacterium]|nr:type II toxin-antitoxin system ParD family antitoxin [Acidobacteriota bacterium]